MVIQVSIVILSHNRLDELSRNLPRLLSESHYPDEFQIIVVDNNSTDGTREFLTELQKKHPEITLVLNDRNLGVAGGRNVGLKRAVGEIVLCLDDDAFLSPDQFGHIASAFGQDPTLGVFCPLVIHGETKLPQNPHGNQRVEIANYHGAAHAFRKEALEKIGFLDEECFFGGEELDSSIRLYDAGYRCVYFSEVVALHYSFMRPGPHGLDRYLRWTYNYARILYKNFPESMAKCYANRLLIARTFHGMRFFGTSAIVQVWKADRKGRMAGKRQHAPVSERTIKIYSNEDLRPEFGNVPLWRKALGKLSR